MFCTANKISSERGMTFVRPPGNNFARGRQTSPSEAPNHNIQANYIYHVLAAWKMRTTHFCLPCFETPINFTSQAIQRSDSQLSLSLHPSINITRTLIASYAQSPAPWPSGRLDRNRGAHSLAPASLAVIGIASFRVRHGSCPISAGSFRW